MQPAGFTRIVLQKMRLGDPDASGPVRAHRLRGRDLLTSRPTWPSWPSAPGANPLISQSTPGLETYRRGYIVADPTTGATSIPGRLCPAAHIVTGAATVISAMGAGRRAGKAIAEKLLGPDAPADAAANAVHPAAD